MLEQQTLFIQQNAEGIKAQKHVSVDRKLVVPIFASNRNDGFISFTPYQQQSKPSRSLLLNLVKIMDQAVTEVTHILQDNPPPLNTSLVLLLLLPLECDLWHLIAIVSTLVAA